MIIDCKDCEMFGTEQCEDCLVMAVLSRKPGSALEIDEESLDAVESLQQAGLAPVLRFKRKAG